MGIELATKVLSLATDGIQICFEEIDYFCSIDLI
jgi:hypothetical protein